ncbi:MAG TPA: fibronectin type III domain-containing protein [Panacibacter sp.]|nr:fibronectin type III domain-containing protein [Panacibacter sp.]
MKKLIYGTIVLLLFPILLFSQKSKWQKTSDGRSVFTEKELNNPHSIATKINIQDDEDVNRNLVTGTIYYIRNNEPWSLYGSNNISLLDQVFGSGNYTVSDYTISPATLFVAGTSIVYLEGSDFNALALKDYLNANITTIENWVSSGGHLFINAASNEGSDINFGFDGTYLHFIPYTSASSSGEIVAGQEAHTIFNGPYAPVGKAWTGNYFSHTYLTGGSAVPLITGTAGTVLSELQWGSGFVLFGGMTTANFHLPEPQANNLRANIYAYLASGQTGCAGPSNLQATKILETAAKLLWALPATAVKSFKILYRVKGDEKVFYERKAGTENRIVLQDLTPNTTYEWYVRSICENGTSKSDLVLGPDFTTLPSGDIANNIRLYPNPVRTNLQIDGLPATEKTKLTIVDFTGNIKLAATGTGKIYNWNIATLKAGNYLLKIETKNTTVSRWFVKE